MHPGREPDNGRRGKPGRNRLLRHFGTVLYFKGGSLDNDDIIRMIALPDSLHLSSLLGLASLFSLLSEKGENGSIMGRICSSSGSCPPKYGPCALPSARSQCFSPLSLLGCSLALMLNQYQNTQLIYKYPFSVSIPGKRVKLRWNRNRRQ